MSKIFKILFKKNFIVRNGRQFSSSILIKTTANRKMSQLPKALVFDLDGCVWDPELYELHGGSPFSTKSDGNLTDSSGTHLYLMGDVRKIMNELKNDSKWSNTVVAIASKCTELQWAHECLEKFQLEDSSNNLKSVFHPDLMEIYWDNKQRHLKVIAEKSGIQLEDMIFFDNQMDNCRDVSQIGVTVSYVPNGVTRTAFDKVIEAFPSPGQIIREK